MNTRTPAALLTLSAAALVSASTEPAAVATDACVEPGEKACPVDRYPPPHTPDYERGSAVPARVSAEQAPPAAPSPGGGMLFNHPGPGIGPPGIGGPMGRVAV